MAKTKQTINYQNLTFTAIIKPAEEGGYYAYCPLLPGCASEGDTYTDAVANIEDAIKGYVETMIANDDPLPIESTQTNYTIDIPLTLPGNKLRFA